MKILLVVALLSAPSWAADITKDGVTWHTRAGSKYYTFVKEAKNQPEAEGKCRQLGGHLALPVNEDEQRYLVGKGREYGGDQWWLGAWAKTSGGNRTFWSKYGPLTYSAWLPGEPNNYLSLFGQEDCVSLYVNGIQGWNDIRCSTSLWFICEKTKSNNTKKYEYKYFDLAARGEVGRLLFALSGVTYTDRRVQMNEWPAMKYQTVWGVLPELVVTEADGTVKKYCQSGAINRQLANEFGLMGKTDEDAYRIDMIVGCMTDVMAPMFTLFTSQGAPTYQATRNSTLEKLPWWLKQTTQLLEQNNGGSSWFVGDKPTLADTIYYHAMWLMQKQFPGTLDKPEFYKLKDLYQRFENVPGIAQWLKSRPQSPFR